MSEQYKFKRVALRPADRKRKMNILIGFIAKIIFSGFAMDRYAYYVCFKCQKAYFGGEARYAIYRNPLGTNDNEVFFCFKTLPKVQNINTGR